MWECTFVIHMYATQKKKTFTMPTSLCIFVVQMWSFCCLQQNHSIYYISILHVNVAGLLNHIYSVDFFKISVLACFCAIHNNGLQTLLLFSAIVRHTSCPPVGFSILRAGLIKPVRLLGHSPRSSEIPGTHGTNLLQWTLTMH